MLGYSCARRLGEQSQAHLHGRVRASCCLGSVQPNSYHLLLEAFLVPSNGAMSRVATALLSPQEPGAPRKEGNFNPPSFLLFFFL